MRGDLLELSETALRRALDEGRNRPWIVAFSGGKDSTLLLHIVVDFLSKLRSPPPLYVLYNDTLAELPPIHSWAMRTGRAVVEYLSSRGVGAEFKVTTPELTETFYWRTIVRGCPAPNFKFRWCIELLKVGPTRRAINEIARGHGGVVG